MDDIKVKCSKCGNATFWATRNGDECVKCGNVDNPQDERK